MAIKKQVPGLLTCSIVLQVHKQNNTKLGELIRDTYKGRCDPLLLKRVSALTVLVEIGVDKLFRDYIHAFLGNNELSSRY